MAHQAAKSTRSANISVVLPAAEAVATNVAGLIPTEIDKIVVVELMPQTQTQTRAGVNHNPMTKRALTTHQKECVELIIHMENQHGTASDHGTVNGASTSQNQTIMLEILPSLTYCMTTKTNLKKYTRISILITFKTTWK